VAPSAGSRTIQFYKSVKIHSIWLTTNNISIVGSYVISFNSYSIVNNPYVSSGSNYALKVITFNSYLAGVNVYQPKRYIETDLIGLTYPSHTGQVNLIFELSY